MEIKIPKLLLVVLIGVSGSGKSTFARKNFLSTEILSSDYCRALVSDDENNLEVTAEAFEVLDFIAGRRLGGGFLTIKIWRRFSWIESGLPLINQDSGKNSKPTGPVLIAN